MPQSGLDARVLGEWFKGGGARGGHEGMDVLERNWDKGKFPPVEQLRLYAEVAHRSIQSRGVNPGDISDIQVRRLDAINRALGELGELDEPLSWGP